MSAHIVDLARLEVQVEAFAPNGLAANGNSR